MVNRNPGPNKDLWVVIPTYNRADDLMDCLASLVIAGISRDQIVVVDNHSQDATIEQVHHHYPDIELIALNENRGATGASNVGFRYALQNDADFILRLDSDTVVDPGFTKPLLDQAVRNNEVGIISPKIYYYDPPDEIWYAGSDAHPWHFGTIHGHRHEKDFPQNSQVREVDYVWGAAMLIKAEVLRKIDGFDADFFVYYEEVDFCNRTKKAGYKLLFVPESKVWHKVGSAANNAWTAFHWNRSKMLLYRKHARNHFHLVSLVLYAFLYAFLSPIFKNKSGNRGPLGPALKGLWKGLQKNQI